MADWQEHGFSGRPFLQLVTLEKGRCGETGKRIDACGMKCGTGDRDPKQLVVVCMYAVVQIWLAVLVMEVWTVN